MAGGEDQAQHVVTDVVLLGAQERFEHIGRVLGLQGFEVLAQRLVLARMYRLLAQVVDRAPLGSGHEPRGRVGRQAGGRPVLQRSH